MLASTMIDTAPLRAFNKEKLLQDLSALVKNDQQQTARILAYIGEIDRRKLYLEHAYPSMFAFCTGRFGMSESMTAKRIRTARAACSFPCIFTMITRGDLHLTGAYQLAPHLTEENHREVLRRAKHRSMREIEKLVAEIAPKPDVEASVRALPAKRGRGTPGRGATTEGSEAGSIAAAAAHSTGPTAPTVVPGAASSTQKRRNGATTPLSPRRYKLQVTIGEGSRETLTELQGLLSHQIPNGDPAAIVERALEALLVETKKKKAAVTDSPRAGAGCGNGRGIPAKTRREVFKRDGGKCAYRDADGRRCGSGWQVEFHHMVPYAKGGEHSERNIELRCRGHNQYEAELEYGELFMATRRGAGRETHFSSAS